MSRYQRETLRRLLLLRESLESERAPLSSLQQERDSVLLLNLVSITESIQKYHSHNGRRQAVAIKEELEMQVAKQKYRIGAPPVTAPLVRCGDRGIASQYSQLLWPRSYGAI